MVEGWIRLYRKIKENKYWNEPRRFSKNEAWIDLLLSASHKYTEFILGNETIRLKRGQLLRSQVKLANEWGWNRETVATFLKMLKRDSQIDTETNNRYTLITVLNWNFYQGLDKENPSTDPTSVPALGQQQDISNPGTINNVKNVDNNKIESLLIEAEKELDKIANKGVVLKHLLIIPEKYHYKVRYFLRGSIKMVRKYIIKQKMNMIKRI